ncbi:MAG: tetratricopeptide repeat protein [Acidiferrobacterales bacterium]
MDDRLYKFLVYTAVVLTVAWIGWWSYNGLLSPGNPGDDSYLAAEKYFEDGYYQKAVTTYKEALEVSPDHIYAKRGMARSLMQLGRLHEALQVFDDIIAREPDFAPSYANRGILRDRMGYYQKALQDYEVALQLDPELAEGPGWITRFFRLQPEKPPTIDRRVAYLRQELAKPASERTMRKPELDEKQRPYKK